MRTTKGSSRLPCPAAQVVRLRAARSAATWSYLPATDLGRVIDEFNRAVRRASAAARACSARRTIRPVRSCRRRSSTRCARAPPTAARGSRSTSPTSASTSRRRPRTTRGRRPITRTSSAFTRIRSGAAVWDAASAGWSPRPDVIDALERVQQCSLLCPDTLVAAGDGALLTRAIADGSLRDYVANAERRSIAKPHASRHGRRRTSRAGRVSSRWAVSTRSSTSAPMPKRSCRARCRRPACWSCRAAASVPSLDNRRAHLVRPAGDDARRPSSKASSRLGQMDARSVLERVPRLRDRGGLAGRPADARALPDRRRGPAQARSIARHDRRSRRGTAAAAI